VAAAIRAEEGIVQPRIVMASSMGAPSRVELESWPVLDAFLTKPVRQSQLISRLGQLLARAGVSGADPDSLPPTVAEAGRPDGPEGAARILLVEDNEVNMLLAKTLLAEVSCDIRCVENGAQAVEAVTEEAFDLILMDMQMPVMDGLEATRRIRALGDARAATPIVAMTANAMQSDQDACYAAGMDDFVSKPFQPDAFLRTVARNLHPDGGAGEEGLNKASAP
nr:response regulator [Phenylobacterium sp.]